MKKVLLGIVAALLLVSTAEAHSPAFLNRIYCQLKGCTMTGPIVTTSAMSSATLVVGGGALAAGKELDVNGDAEATTLNVTGSIDSASLFVGVGGIETDGDLTVAGTCYGCAAANLVTTDTTQSITGPKAFTELRYVDSGTIPTCDVTRRGHGWMDFGANGVADSLLICSKNAYDVYGWYSAGISAGIVGNVMPLQGNAFDLGSFGSGLEWYSVASRRFFVGDSGGAFLLEEGGSGEVLLAHKSGGAAIGFINPPMSASVSNASGTITPTAQMFHVSGTTTTETIAVPTGAVAGLEITIIPDGIFLTGLTGNIGNVITSTANVPIHCVWDATKWYCVN